MAGRFAAFRQRTAGDALDGVRDLAHEQASSPIRSPHIVEAEWSAATTVTVRHGLGRRYSRAWCVGASAAHTAPLLALTPTAAAAAGADPATHIVLVTSGAYTGSTEWVVC